MEIRHHPNDTTLLAYAAGGLAQSLSVLTATHLAMCPRCRARVAEAEQAGGAMLAAAGAVPMRSGSLDAVLARVAAVDGAEPIRARARRHVAPAPLGDLLPEEMARVRWWPLGPGIRQAFVGKEGGGIKLLRIAPGRSVPRHGHRGQEMTLILSGSYSDETGRYMAGDIADMDSEIDHQPISDSDVDCICVIAADAPLVFRGLVSRLMQPFVRI